MLNSILINTFGIFVLLEIFYMVFVVMREHKINLLENKDISGYITKKSEITMESIPQKSIDFFEECPLEIEKIQLEICKFNDRIKEVQVSSTPTFGMYNHANPEEIPKPAAIWDEIQRITVAVQKGEATPEESMLLNRVRATFEQSRQPA